jgi:uncharacterized protein (TIGR03435 family)
MTEHTLRKMNTGVHRLFVAAVLIASAELFAQGQTGATNKPASSVPANAPYVATMTFDVASVRENKDAEKSGSSIMSGGPVPGTTTLRVTNWTIDNLIGIAYNVDHFQMVGLPNWPWSTVFVVEAKGGSEADAKMASLTGDQQWAEQQHMLQVLLADRFKLKTHWESREGDVYNLVPAKGGPKLGAAGSMPPAADDLKMFGDHPLPPLFEKNDGEGYDFVAHGFDMVGLVRLLTGQFGRPVNDKTGLTGKYDFVLKFKGNWDRDRPADDLDPTPPMDRALQEELGLKVEPAKGPIKLLVIDHVEKPSEN